MRIIAGEFRRRVLRSPPAGSTTRPMPDRVKESLFGLLGEAVVDSVFVDVFAGTGSVGLEALSRGATRCVFIERDRRVVDVLSENIAMLGCGDRAEIVTADALGSVLMGRLPDDLDLVFLDPPYALVGEVEGWGRVCEQASRLVGRLRDTGFLMLRTPWPHKLGVAAEADVAEEEDDGELGVGRGKRGGRGVKGVKGGKKGSGGVRRGGEELVWSLQSSGDRLDEDALAELESAMFGDADGGGGGSGGRKGLKGKARDGGGVVGEAGGVVGGGGGVVFASHGLAGAVGPETHAYGGTAVHFYQRVREGG